MIYPLVNVFDGQKFLFSPTEDQILTWLNDHSVRVWDIQIPQKVHLHESLDVDWLRAYSDTIPGFSLGVRNFLWGWEVDDEVNFTFFDSEYRQPKFL